MGILGVVNCPDLLESERPPIVQVGRRVEEVDEMRGIELEFGIRCRLQSYLEALLIGPLGT